MSTYGPTIFELATQQHDPVTCTREPCSRCGPRKPSAAPPLDPHRHQHQGPTPAVDPVVRLIGLPSHPEPAVIADALEEAAKEIRSKMLRAKDMASVLAAKGYSAQTLGDGGSRGSDTTSSTERHSARHERWEAADYAYAQMLRTAWLSAHRATAQTRELLRHADDVDPTPAGQGECRACARFVRRDPNRSSDRIISGLCQTCYRAWHRYMKAGGPMLWSDWVATRREGYTERDPAGKIVAIHTPDRDPDLEDAC